MFKIRFINLSNSMLNALEDPSTDPRLLPSWWQRSDNSSRLKHYKIALRKAINNCLSPRQREQLELYYAQGLSKSEIARRQNTGCSAVTKSLRSSHEAIRRYVEMYMEIYTVLERELLSEE